MTTDLPPISTARWASPFPARHARGPHRAARAGARRRSSPRTPIRRAIEALLAEALTLAALIGSTLKDAGGQLTLQAQTENGVVQPAGVRLSRRRAARLCPVRRRRARRRAGRSRRCSRCSAQGYLAITFDQAATGERYQGIVPLDGDTLAEAARELFRPVRADPDLVRLGVARRRARPPCRRRAVPPASARGRGWARAAPHPARSSRMGACRGARRRRWAPTSWPIRRCRSRR